MNKGINRKLIVAYSKLLERTDEKISVTLLCADAGVSRATFYIYYPDLEGFQKKLSDYIIDKFFRQAVAILYCGEAELSTTVKKENLILDECELGILRYMVHGTNYIDFVLLAESCCMDKIRDELALRAECEKYKDDIDLFFRGYLPILVDGLTKYSETRFRKDMKNCRFLFKALCDYMRNDKADK